MEWGGLEAVINRNNGKTNPIQKSIHLFLVLKLCWLVTVGGKKQSLRKQKALIVFFNRNVLEKTGVKLKGDAM